MALKSNDWIGIALADGRYVITAKLGEGGMGLVYRARDTRLGMDVVIKMPRQAMLDDPEFSGRFAHEIRSLVRLSHPCIVKVTDVGQQDGLPFAIMQYLSGGSLENRLVTPGGQAVAVDPKTVPGWLQGVASALDYIHSQGYVHRDVKPGNILFDSQGYSFLGDFGVIKALAATEATRSKTVTGAGLVLGTPEYMAPELIMGGKVDGRADQYALAVTVYEALCGRRPFEGASATAVLVLQTTQPPVPMSEVRPNLPDRLSQAVLKGLAKDASQRHASCAALATAIVAAIEASPAFAPGASAPNPASSESVKVLCPSCGKKITMVLSTYNILKRTGKNVPCPACQQPVQVASKTTQVLSAPARGPGSTRSGTEILPAMGAGRVSPATKKIPTANVVPGEASEVAPRGRVKTQILGQAQTQLLPQSPALDPPPTTRSRLPLIGIGATAALLVIAVLGYILLPRGSREAPLVGPVRIPSVPKVPAEVPKPIEAAGATPLPPVTTPAPGDQLRPEVPGVDRNATAEAAGGSETVPGLVATVSPDISKPVVAVQPADRPRAEANRTFVKSGASPPLEEILATPEKYGDQEIAPKGLFRVGRYVNYAPDGTTTIAVNQSGLTVKLTAPQTPGAVPIEGGKTVTMEVERELADRFVAQDIATRGSASSLTMATWHSKVAILTLRVFHSGEAGWVYRIIKAEFLLDFDLIRIGQDLFKQSFLTLTLTPDAEHRGPGDGPLWKERLGLHFTNQIKGLYRSAKAQQSLAKWAQVNMQLNQIINTGVRNAAAANAAEEAARRSALMPK